MRPWFLPNANAVPFKSLRYQPGTAQVWGFNAMRVKRSKNEISTLTRVPPARGQSGFQQAQFAASLVGIEAPRAGLTMDVKPYAISSLTTDNVSNRAFRIIPRPKPAWT